MVRTGRARIHRQKTCVAGALGHRCPNFWPRAPRRIWPFALGRLARPPSARRAGKGPEKVSGTMTKGPDTFSAPRLHDALSVRNDQPGPIFSLQAVLDFI